MADDSGTSKGGSRRGSMAWLWMILALVTVGGFLTWLGMEAEPTSVTVTEELEDPAMMDPPSIPVVRKDSLAANKGQFVAQDIRVHNVRATGTLGDLIFWGELGDETTQIPLLVRLDSAAAAGDSISGPFTPQRGAFYSIRGRVFPMSDSLATAWGEQGQFFGEGEQTQAAFTDYYMQASDIRPTPPVLRESTAPQDTGAAGTEPTGESSEGAMTGEAGASG